MRMRAMLGFRPFSISFLTGLALALSTACARAQSFNCRHPTSADGAALDRNTGHGRDPNNAP
jgi:hypothetical protein